MEQNKNQIIQNPTILEAKEIFDIIILAMSEISIDLFGTEPFVGFFNLFSIKSRFNPKNILCFYEENEIVGAVCSYGGRDVDLFDKNAKKILNINLEKECEDDEYYIDSIAVKKEYRGKGIMKKLLNAAFENAKKQNYKKISLLSKNPNIYLWADFKVVDNFKLYHQNYYKMIKYI